MTLDGDTLLYAPDRIDVERRDGLYVLIDPSGPNWLATDARGAAILETFRGGRPLSAAVRDYSARHRLEWHVAWQHVDTVVRDALRQGFVATAPPMPKPYPGRAPWLENASLDELWLHTNNSCNLSCRHCLVSSGPDGDRGLPAETLVDVIRQARALGVRRFYFTGGEPTARPDFVELCREALADPDAELAVLTNGTLLDDRRLSRMQSLDRSRMRLQISLDGASPAVNDAIRGRGTFERIVAGIRRAAAAGWPVTVTTTITRANADDVPEVTRLLARLGVQNHHLLWLHKRGRAAGEAPDTTPEVSRVIEVVRACRRAGREVGVTIDNWEAIRARVNAPAGVRRDLSNACVSSLCVYSDGTVYPSAAMAGVPELACGSILEAPLGRILSESEVARRFRAATVEQKPLCGDCPFKFLCGGGDIEHAYFYGGSILAHDPYCELHKAMITDALFDRALERKAVLSDGEAGYSAPLAITAMGEGTIHCATGEPVPEVVTSHSECVRSFEIDEPRRLVREFYGAAAAAPQAELCCPVRPEPEDVAHIPRKVLDRFYGCGSPIADADVRPGETTLDLGSGAGIDVFICARKVGPEGRAIGVDMTDEMLEIARESQREVAERLGYDVVEFRKGFLEEIPVDDETVDLVTSNCVINLSPDKKRVFREMWRVLKDHGRIVVSDIVSDEAVPPEQRRDPRLWGECISGALTEEEFLLYLERCGFHGIEVLRKTFWREVSGYRFHSITVRAFKFRKKSGCVYAGQRAVYLGPFKGVTDEEGHFFPRGVPVEVCTDTAAKLSHPPYAGSFLIEGEPAGEGSGCGPGCC
ncbi:MAG: radical SAM protein [Acidobacteria bacterium]|nr:MAG: radical SAM protein [Acidobacteriota bacterium]